MDLNIGVTNPYAVAELVAGKPIRWSSLADPVGEVTRILQVPEKALFSSDSPLLRPDVLKDAGGGIKALEAPQVRERLSRFLDTHRSAGLEPSPRLRIRDDARTRIVTDLLSTSGPHSGNSTPWQPANTEWADKGDFFEDVGQIDDPIQGSLANCYFIAAMSSVAWARPYAIANVIKPSSGTDEEAPVHRVTFYRNGTGAGEPVEVGERVPVQAGSKAWRYARSLDAGETWPAILEKAYGKWKTANTTDFPDYGPMAYGDAVMACAQIVRGNRNYWDHTVMTVDQMVSKVRSNSMSKRTFNPMVCWTYDESPAGTDYGAARVVGNHAYSILGWEWRNNEYYIVVRNPWGTHEATLDVLSGSWTSTGNGYSAALPLNTHGVFSMKASTFKKYFAGLGWVV